MFCSCCGHTFKFLLPFIYVRKHICHVSLFDCRVFLWLGIAVKLDKSQIRYAPCMYVCIVYSVPASTTYSNTSRATFRANFSHRSVIGDTKSLDKYYWTFSIWSIRRLRSLAWLLLLGAPLWPNKRMHIRCERVLCSSIKCRKKYCRFVDCLLFAIWFVSRILVVYILFLSLICFVPFVAFFHSQATLHTVYLFSFSIDHFSFSACVCGYL